MTVSSVTPSRQRIDPSQLGDEAAEIVCCLMGQLMQGTRVLSLRSDVSARAGPIWARRKLERSRQPIDVTGGQLRRQMSSASLVYSLLESGAPASVKTIIILKELDNCPGRRVGSLSGASEADKRAI